MRLDTSQQLKLSQEMKLSPKMIQAMEILQLPAIALQERIDAELAANPVLEVAELPSEPDQDYLYEPERGESDLVLNDSGANTEGFARLDDMTSEFGYDFASEAPAAVGRYQSETRDAKLDALANTPAPTETLADYLTEQILFLDLLEPVEKAAVFLIDFIEPDGYIRLDLAQIADRENCDFDIETLKDALAVIQTLDPVGIGARDLKQCLQIQLTALENAGKDVTLPKLLVSSFLKEIEMNRLPAISRKIGRPIEAIKEALAELARLNPKPGYLIGQSAAPTITPDVVVTLGENDEIIVTMSEDYSSGLTISELYQQQASDSASDKDTKKFLRKNIRSAQWIIEAIAQRKRTIRRVTEEIFKVQHDFLTLGDKALKPLPMSDIADKVGVHVATVSRAVADKYVLTGRGIFPLRMFFSGGTKNAAGDDVSWDAIKVKLREIVDSEDKKKPLSDDKLAAELKKAGLSIARRTVAKYRDLLDIPPARKRKVF